MAKMRNAVQEVRGAVDRIDDEAVGFVGPVADARFLAQEGVAGPRPRQFLDQDTSVR